MLNKFQRYIILPIYLLLFLSVFSFANAGFEEDYQGYLKTYDSYRASYEKYATTRNQYLTYGTLNAKNDALVAGKDMITQRDDVLLSYISLLKSRNTDQVYTNLLDDETTFLLAHKNKIPGVSSLEDTVETAKEVEDRHLPLQVAAKKITATIIYNKVVGVKEAYISLENDATALIHNLKLKERDVSTLERWLLEAKNKELLADQKLSQASSKIASLKGSSLDQLNQGYNEMQFVLFEANQYLKEALRFMNELSESIKYGQF